MKKIKFRQTFTPNKQPPEQPPVVNPARFEDSVALQTAWTPLKPTNNYDPFYGAVVKTTPHRLECRLESKIYIICGVLILIGIFTLFTVWWLGLFGLLLILIGVSCLYSYLSPWVLDRQQGQFWCTRKPEKGKTACSLFELHALQFLSKTWRGDDEDDEEDKLTIYQLNGVFSDGQRILFLENSKPRRLWKNAEEIATFLQLPLWDGTGKFQQLAYTPTEEELSLVRVADPQKRPFPWWELLLPNITLLLALWLFHWDSVKIIWAFFLEIAMIFIVSLFRPTIDEHSISDKLGSYVMFMIFYGISAGLMYILLHTDKSESTPLLLPKPSELWFVGTALLFLFAHCLTLFVEHFRGGIRSINHENSIAVPLVLCFNFVILSGFMRSYFIDSVWGILMTLILVRALATLINHWIQQYKRKHY